MGFVMVFLGGGAHHITQLHFLILFCPLGRLVAYISGLDFASLEYISFFSTGLFPECYYFIH